MWILASYHIILSNFHYSKSFVFVEKDSVSLAQFENNDQIIKNEGTGREDVFRFAHPNGLTSEENGVASCGDALEMLNCAIADYLSGFGNSHELAISFVEIQIEYLFYQL